MPVTKLFVEQRHALDNWLAHLLISSCHYFTGLTLTKILVTMNCNHHDNHATKQEKTSQILSFDFDSK